MSRIKLKLPADQHFIFSTEITPRISDINYGNHLGHDHLITLLHEARMRFFKKYDFSELNIAGSSIIMADLAISYKAEVAWGESLIIKIALCDPSRVGCDFFYFVTKEGSNEEVARAKTGIVFFDYKKKKISRIPEAFAKLLP
ncbi:thioesterase family protein [bacterium]|nr:thioesterase family protein [bacterium]